MTMRNSKTIDRLPPQDTEAEQSVLGSILINKESFFKIADFLNSGDFYLPAHKKIFDAILDLSDKGQPLYILSVSSRLKEKGELEGMGGQVFLTKLVNSVPSAAHIDHYAGIVHKKSVLRKLIESSYTLAELGYRESEDIEILLDEAEKNVFQISQRANSQNFISLKSALVILAARPSFGKSSMALDIARHAAVKHKIPVGIFSLEMSHDQIVDRF